MSAPASTRPARTRRPGEPSDVAGWPAGLRADRPAGSSWTGWRPGFAPHRTSLLSLGIPLVLVIVATAWNLQGWPGRVDEDEGTYVAEAWAMIFEHHLAPYTYWYDHPPLGWAQLAGYIWLTDGFARYSSSIEVGREFMLLVAVASSVLIYVLCRRLRFRPATAGITVALFGLSPLAVYYHRMVSLDNIGTLWLLAAMVAATSRRRSLGAAFWAGMFSAVAVLSKETIAILLPVVFWLIWQQSHPHTRKWHLAVYSVTVALLTAFYPLFARAARRAVPRRRARLAAVGGVVAAPRADRQRVPARQRDRRQRAADALAGHRSLAAARRPGGWRCPRFFVRRLRPLGVRPPAAGDMALTGGYLPYFYVTAMMPFAALLIGGVADALWNPVTLGAARVGPPDGGDHGRGRGGAVRRAAVGERAGQAGRAERRRQLAGRRPPGWRGTCPSRTSWSSTTTCGST